MIADFKKKLFTFSTITKQTPSELEKKAAKLRETNYKNYVKRPNYVKRQPLP